MRCQCCNNNLSDWESTARDPDTGLFRDMCKRCIKSSGIKVVGRKDLNPDVEIDDSYDFDPMYVRDSDDLPF